LERGLSALGEGPRDLPERQRTLQATLAWSYALLDPAAQALFRRLGAFGAGGCTPDAATTVCGEPGEPADALLDRLAALAERSLLRVEDHPDEEPRLGMLETIRAYALEQLASGGEEEAQRRHATHYLALAERSEPLLRGPDQVMWLARLAREHDNLRAALGWACAAPGGEEVALRLAGALAPFWEIAGHLREGRAWLERVLARGEGVSGAILAKALAGASALAWAQGDPQRAEALGERALRLYRELDDGRGIVEVASNVLVFGAFYRGEMEAAERLAQESQARADALADPWSQARARDAVAALHAAQGDLEAVAALRAESLRLYRAAGDTRGVALTVSRLAGLAVRQGAYAQAAQRGAEAQGLFEELGDRGGVAETLFLRGRALHEGGDDEAAAALYARSLALRRERGDLWGSMLASFYLVLLLRDRGAGPGWDEAREVLVRVEDELPRVAGWEEALNVALNVRALLGAVARDRGDAAEADAHFRAVVTRAAQGDIAERPAIASALVLALGEVTADAAARGEPWRAARLAGAAAALQHAGALRGRDPLGIRLSLARVDEARRLRLEDDLRAALGEEGLEAALDEGRALGAPAALVDALGVASRSGRR
jgi:hypothetical protein